MISFQKIRRFFSILCLSLVVFAATIVGFGATDVLAATSMERATGQSPIQLATMSQAEIMGKNKEGNSEKAQAANAKEAKRFKAATLEGMNNSIVNPDYQPSGKSKQSDKENGQATDDIKAEALDAFN